MQRTLRRGAIFASAMLLLILSTYAYSLAPLGQPETHTGSVSNEVPFVEVPFSVATDGSHVVLDVLPTSGDLDTLLYLVDANSLIVAENDDRAQGDYSSRIEFAQATAGDYTVVVTRYGVADGTSAGEFSLSVEVAPPVEAATVPYAVTADDLVAAGYPELETRPEAEWTILVYYGGDNNLEEGILHDLDEFERAGGSTDQVRIVALVDRSPEYTDSNGNWNSVRLFEVGADTTGDYLTNYPPTIDSEPLADLGQLDTGNGETLAQFLVWGMKTFPAQRYSVAFGSHGAGWRGLITDDTSDHSIISLPELERAFTTALEQANISKFDLLINDACLMSSVEYFDTMGQYFDVSFASAELVVNPALDMTALTQALQTDPALDLTTLAPLLVDAYMLRDVQGSLVSYLTNSMTNLNTFQGVPTALDEFARVTEANMLEYSTVLGQARANTYTYTFFAGDTTMVDLGHYMQQVIAFSDDIALIRAAEGVIRSLEDSRIYGEAGNTSARLSTHYNIYFPSDGTDFRAQYLEETSLGRWGSMLRTYNNVVAPRLWLAEDSLESFHPPVAPKVTVTRVYPTTTSNFVPPTVSMEVVGRRVAQGSFTVDRLLEDGRLLRLQDTDILTQTVIGSEIEYINRWRSGVDQSVFGWMPLQLPVVSDGTVQYNERLTLSGETAILEGRYQAIGSEDWQDVAAVFGLDGTVQNVISRATQNGALGNVVIPAGTVFESYVDYVQPDGQVKREVGNTYTWPEGGLTFSEQNTPSGDYELGFLVETFGGTRGFDSVRVTVDNGTLPQDVNGFVDTVLGVSFTYPEGYSPVVDAGNQLVSVSPDGQTKIAVYYFPAENNIYDITAQANRFINITPDLPYGSNSVGGKTAVDAIYRYTDAQGVTWEGRLFSIYSDLALQGGTAFVGTIETQSGDLVERDRVFDVVEDSLVLFNARDVAASDESVWRYRRLPDSTAYPVPRTWTLSVDDAGWVRHQPLADSPVSIALNRRDDITAEDWLAELLTASAIPAEAVQQRVYQGEYHLWNVATYNDVSTYGRFYTAQIGNAVYAIQFQTPLDADTLHFVRDVFEPMIDAFAPSPNAVYASGGVNPAFVKAATISTEANCGDAPENSVCFGQGAFTVIGSDGAEISVSEAQVIDLAEVSRIEVGVAGETLDPYSVAVLSLPSGAADGSPTRLLVFGGASIVPSAFQQQVSLQANTRLMSANRGRGLIQTQDRYALEVLMVDGGAETENTSANSIVILVPPGASGETLRLNDLEIETTGGATLVFDANPNNPDEALTELDAPATSSEADLVNQRRPQSFSLNAMTGVARVGIPPDAILSQSSRPTSRLTLTGGIAASFNGQNVVLRPVPQRLYRQTVAALSGTQGANAQSIARPAPVDVLGSLAEAQADFDGTDFDIQDFEDTDDFFDLYFEYYDDFFFDDEDAEFDLYNIFFDPELGDYFASDSDTPDEFSYYESEDGTFAFDDGFADVVGTEYADDFEALSAGYEDDGSAYSTFFDTFVEEGVVCDTTCAPVDELLSNALSGDSSNGDISSDDGGDDTSDGAEDPSDDGNSE
ncbi:MAG: clostripain-related cysteine peptidase [Phototrophicaceae bacterium]